MTQATAKKSFADRIAWDTRIKPWLTILVIAALAFLIALFIVAPQRAAAQPNHLPSTFLSMPTGAVELSNVDGTGVLLPVRVADTSSARNAGFEGVGADASDNQFLLYALTRQTSNRASYSVDGLRTPVEFAAIDAAGNVSALHVAPEGASRVSIPEPHQWLLAAEVGAFERFGIGEGSVLDPESIRKF